MIATRRLLLSLALILCSIGAHAAQPLESQVDSLCSQYTVAGSPGCVVGIVKDGALIFQKGYGLAELENHVPMTGHSVLDIGSNAKQFTATCILLLQEQGKLSIDDDIRKYIPEFPVYPWTITLRHLMQHTSGVRDYFDLMTLKGMNIGNNYPTEEYHKLIFGQPELNFQPGEQHLYSNSGFILLAEIVRRVSGLSLGEFARLNIFEPLGMKHTLFCDDPFIVVEDRASNYGPLPSGEYWRGSSIAANVGDGGILSTVADLALWDGNFYVNKLGKGDPDLLRQLEVRTILNSGDTLMWAMGLRHELHNGKHVIRHGGAYYGFRSEIARFPEQKVTSIVLGNVASLDATDLAYQVADLVMPHGDTIEVVAEREDKPLQLSRADLEARVGKFRNPTTGTIWDITANDTALSVVTSTGYSFQLMALEGGQFRPSGIAFPGTVMFVKLDSGEYTIDLLSPGQQPARFQPVRIDAMPTDLGQYVGEFRCRELDITFVFSMEGDALSFFTKGQADKTSVQATIRDEFIAQGGQTQLRFERDNGDQIRALRLSLPRAKNILFERVSS